jgi:hypothetical protein
MKKILAITSTKRTRIISIAVLFVLMSGSGLFAANQVVTTNSDAGAGSLRQAIADVSDGGTITFNLSAGNETIVILTELLITGKGVTIDGSNSWGSPNQVTVQVTTPGTSPYRVFHEIADGKTSYISNMTIKGGYITGSGGYGGGIYLEQGTLNLSHVTVSDAQAYQGGGIAMVAPTSCTFDWVTVSNCTGTLGGGLYCGSDNNLTLNNCLFTGNTTSDPVPSKSPKSSGAYGGGICNIGTMTINQCEISENVGAGAYSVYGIGIANLGAITISGSVIKNNSYSGDKGAIGGGIVVYSEDANVTCIIENSTISGNSINSTTSAGVMGAGIGFFNVDVTGAIINCTVSENTATAPSMALGGGVCVLLASVAISNSTIANNVASEAGAGICQVAGTLSIKNTIIAQNSDNSTKFDYNAYTAYGPWTLNDNGNNIVQYQNVSADAGNSFNATTDFLYNTKYNASGTAFTNWTKGGDANGGSLNLAYAVASNGGPTQTLAITPGSIAIHSGAWDDAVTKDQRGTNRHEGTPAIGAFELRPAPGYFYSIDPPPTWDYEGNWEDGIVPGATDNVSISPNAAFNPRIYTNVVCNDLNIPAGMNVTVYPGYSLTVNGTLQNNAGIYGVRIYSTASGTGSLIHHTANVQGFVARYLPGASQSWHFLSSPVAAQAISPDFVQDPPTDYDFFTWYEAGDTWVNFKNTTIAPTWETANYDNNFAAGKGYLVEYTGTDLIKTFSGNLNSGPIAFNLSRTGTGAYARYNLAGNPYPSAIDWKAASGWDRTNLELNGGGYDMSIWNDALSTGNYGTFNSASLSGTGTNGVSQYIQVGQGFMVKAIAPGKAPLLLGIQMDDRVRVHNTQAYLKSTDEVANVLRMKVSGNVNSYSDEIVVEFGHPTADGGAEKMFSFYETAPSLYTVKPDGNYSIDFRGEPGAVTIPLSFKAGADGNYTITASQLESFGSSTDITLEDMKLAKTQNLIQNPVYSYFAGKNDDAARFLLHFGGAFSIDENAKEQPVKVYASGNTVYISNTSGSEMKGEVYVYNTLGQIMMQQKLSDNLAQFSLNTGTGYYLVKVITEDNAYTSKVFIQR